MYLKSTFVFLSLLLLLALNGAAQNNVKVPGLVLSQNGAALAGASVEIADVETGNTSHIITDSTGGFIVTMREARRYNLYFSYVGYQPDSLINFSTGVGEKSSIMMRLSQDKAELSEVIVVGYGTQRKVNVIGAISQINAKDINSRSVTQATQALTGQMPGITVTQRSGQPGGGSAGTIRIRGVASFGANPDALVLVDGIPGQMSNIDPQDIASVSVLKDAASAAIYGSRAANGVILVTTKSGQSLNGKMRISYNGYIGTQKATQYPEFVSAWEYAQLINEATPGSYTEDEIEKFRNGSDPDNYPDVNYIDLIFKRGTMQTGHNFSIANRTDATDYLLSLGYLYQNGIVERNDYQRYNLRFNMTNHLTERLKLSTRLGAIQELNDQPAPSATQDFNAMLAAISQVVRIPAIYPYKLSNGDLGTGMANKGTPYSYLNNESFYRSKWTNLLVNLRLDWEVIDGLTFSAIGGYTNNTLWDRRFLANQVLNANVKLGPGNLTQNNETVEYKTFQQLLNYKTSYNKHNLDILLGHTYEYNGDRTASSFRNGYVSNSLVELNAGDPGTQTNTGNKTEWAMESYFGRVQYNYNSKYLGEITVRRDGSSRFPPTMRYYNFPGYAIGWRISQEPFFKDNISWINELKIRASYGTLGNQNIGNYPWQRVLKLGSDLNYPIGDAIAPGSILTTLSDTTLHWESTRTKDIALESAMFNNRLSLSVTYFERYGYDILANPSSSYSNVLGFDVGTFNAGKLSNNGWEFEMSYNDNSGKLSYGARANFTILKNKVIDLGPGLNIPQPNGLFGNGSDRFLGYPLEIYYGYRSDGLFTDVDDINNYVDQTAINPNPKPGDIRYKDISGPEGKPDGKVDATYDREILGSRIPKYSYGFSLNLGYEGFDFSALLQGVAAVKGRLTNYAGYAFYQNGNIQRWQMENRWTEANPDRNAGYPRLEEIPNSGTPNTLLSDYWILNANYLRIKNMQLGYSFNQQLLKRLGVQGLRVYAAAENLATFSRYPKGWDPEINTAGDYYPILGNYTIGVNVNF